MVSAVAQHGRLGLGHRLEARIAVLEEEDVVPQVVEEEERLVGVVAEVAVTAAVAAAVVVRASKENKTHAEKQNRAKIANSKQTPISFGIASISVREGLIFRVLAVNPGIGLAGRNYLEIHKLMLKAKAAMSLHNIQRLKKPR